MVKKEKAFTILELLIAMAIIGVITAAAMFTIQRYDKGIRFLYANTYHNIDRAFYNAFNYTKLSKPFVTTENDDNGEEVEVTPQEGARRLCEMLIEYLDHISANCSADNLADDMGVNLGTVKFITPNGSQFFISKRLPDEDNENFDPETDHRFFLVYVNLLGNDISSGNAYAHKMDYEPPTDANKHVAVDPKVFAFAALDNGRICPLGPPEVDPRFMQSRVVYTASALIKKNENDEKGTMGALSSKYTAVSKPYYIAKAEAWGYYTNDEPENRDLHVIDEDPLSYNDYIRSMLPADNKIYAFLNGRNLRVPSGITLKSASIENGGYACREFSGEECWIIIDQYLY